MKKKNSFLRLALVLVVLASVCASLFAGNTTLAMYAATATGTGSATVAKFDVMVNAKKLVNGMTSGTGTLAAADLDLFSVITELNAGAAAGTLQAGDAMDLEVANDGTKNTRIAPGTDGSLPFAITNNSEVDVQFTYTIKANAAIAAATHPTLTFTNGEGTLDSASNTKYGAVTITTSSASAFTSGDTIATITGKLVLGGGSYTNATLNWAWPFEDGSGASGAFPVQAAIDSPIGILANSTLTYPVTVELTVVQID